MALEPSLLQLGSGRLLVVNGFERIWIGGSLSAVVSLLVPVCWWALGEFDLGLLRAMAPLLGLGLLCAAAPFLLGDVIWLNKRAGVVRWGFFGRRRCPVSSFRAVRVVVPASGARRGYGLSLIGQGAEAGDLAVGVSYASYTRERFKQLARRLADFLGVPLEECQVSPVQKGDTEPS
jgi:hypothetical protein